MFVYDVYNSISQWILIYEDTVNYCSHENTIRIFYKYADRRKDIYINNGIGRRNSFSCSWWRFLGWIMMTRQTTSVVEAIKLFVYMIRVIRQIDDKKLFCICIDEFGI